MRQVKTEKTNKNLFCYRNICIFCLLLLFIFGCKTNSFFHNNEYDYFTTDLYIDRIENYPSPDNLVIEIKVLNREILKTIKRRHSSAFRLRTDITNEKEHVFVKHIRGNICKISYPTSYFIVNNYDSIPEKINYEIFFNKKLLKRKIK